MTQSRNEVLLEGRPMACPVRSHENHGTVFYRFLLQVPRLSGTPDLLPVVVPEGLTGQVREEEPLRLRGQLRSFNNRSGTGSKLVLTIYGMEILPSLNTSCNQITLSGALCKDPVFRRTPLGRSICDLMLAVPRRYGRADYLPVIAWGQLAMQARELRTGDPLLLEGRVQSRVYQKVTTDGIEERTAYEVSMMRLLPPEEPEISEWELQRYW